MNDKEGVVEYRLDTLTRSVRFAAGIAPRTVTRVGLGVALAVEDAAIDSAGELLGAKLHQGTGALASTFGSIASSACAAVSSGAQRLGTDGSLVSRVPALEGTRALVSQAASEVKGAWTSAGHVSIQVEEPVIEPIEAPAAPSAGSDPESTVLSANGIEEMNS